MGNSPSQAPGEGNEEEENKQREASASGSTSGLSMLKAGAAVAGTALLAVGTWQLLSQSSSGDAADTDEDERKGTLVGERVKGARGGGGPYSQLEAFQRSSPVGRHNLYIPPHARSRSNFYKVLTYNVWFREDLELNKRMKAIGDLLQQHSPDLICFQEVTPNIYKIFQESSWWKNYQCSVPQELAAVRSYFCMQMSKLSVKAFRYKPFGNSIMGRELCIAETDVGMGKTLVIATSHLESPCPARNQMYSRERVGQAKESLQLLNSSQNVIFCGDMNWDDKIDGDFPLPPGWVDAWTELRLKENGWTYDTKSNPMLTGNWTLQKRLDRFICNLKGFKIISIDMIGLDPIPGLSYLKEKKVRNEMKKLVLPVLPSDHYGLLLGIQACELVQLKQKIMSGK